MVIAVALKRLDDLEGAEKVLQKAHAFAPQDPLILINYAIVLEALGSHDTAAGFLTALNDITAVIDVDPQVNLAGILTRIYLCSLSLSFPLGPCWKGCGCNLIQG